MKDMVSQVADKWKAWREKTELDRILWKEDLNKPIGELEQELRLLDGLTNHLQTHHEKLTAQAMEAKTRNARRKAVMQRRRVANKLKGTEVKYYNTMKELDLFERIYDIRMTASPDRKPEAVERLHKLPKDKVLAALMSGQLEGEDPATETIDLLRQLGWTAQELGVEYDESLEAEVAEIEKMKAMNKSPKEVSNEYLKKLNIEIEEELEHET